MTNGAQAEIANRILSCVGETLRLRPAPRLTTGIASRPVTSRGELTCVDEDTFWSVVLIAAASPSTEGGVPVRVCLWPPDLPATLSRETSVSMPFGRQVLPREVLKDGRPVQEGESG